MVLIKPLIALLATSALAMKLMRHLNRPHARRLPHGERHPHRDAVQRWEGEGGAPRDPVSR